MLLPVAAALAVYVGHARKILDSSYRGYKPPAAAIAPVVGEPVVGRFAAVETTLVLSVNGVEHKINPSPSLLLSDYLRNTLLLTGTKVACGEGGCGACTVVAVGADGVQKPINACLRLLCACDGLAITTAEGSGFRASAASRRRRSRSPTARARSAATPGWVGAISALLAASAQPGAAPLTAKVIEQALDGNLCRCTGYRPILRAFKDAFGIECDDDDSDHGCCTAARPPPAPSGED